jgi:hypothetical protein
LKPIEHYYHFTYTQVLESWKMTNATLEEVEQRGAALGSGEENWVRANMRIFTKTYQMKAVDWLNISRGAGLHIFDDYIGLGQPDEDKALVVEGWESMLMMFQMCCVITCNVDGEPQTQAMRARYNSKPPQYRILHLNSALLDATQMHIRFVHVSMRQLKTKIVTYLATYEREVPPIFMHTYPHIIIHIPEQILRWGSARSIWCFFLERYAPVHTYTY